MKRWNNNKKQNTKMIPCRFLMTEEGKEMQVFTESEYKAFIKKQKQEWKSEGYEIKDMEDDDGISTVAIKGSSIKTFSVSYVDGLYRPPMKK